MEKSTVAPCIIPQRADPFVVRHTDGLYYFTATLPDYDGICLRRAKTLAGLIDAPETEIWHAHAHGPMGAHIWAPELHFLDGRWYIYFGAGNAEDAWRLRPYVLCCADADPLTGHWEELGPMQPAAGDTFSFSDFSLDATVFEAAGRRYFVWAQSAPTPRHPSSLFIAEMESPSRLKTPAVMITTPDYDWERVGFWVNEGPVVMHHNGRVFLTFSASATGACYCVGLLYADETADLLSPASWTKHPRPVLTTRPAYKVYGPGHNSFTTDEEGHDVMFYHARDYEEIVGDPLDDPNRGTRALRVEWDEHDLPVFAYENTCAL